MGQTGSELADLETENTAALIRTGPDEAITLHGLNHMMVGRGFIRGWRWTGTAVENIFSHELDGAPSSFVKDGDSTLVFTPYARWRVSTRGETRRLHEWKRIWPRGR